MTTALQIITKAMQKVGVLVKSESPSADESADALDMLNDILASWSNDSIFIISRVTESFTLAAGTSSYTIGASQTFNTTRPIYIVEAHIRQNNTDYPVSIEDDEIYQRVTDKTLQSIPYMLNYSNGFPTGTIKLYPSPAEAYTLFITSEKELTSFALADTVSLPPGWKKALIYNLAVELAPEYGQNVDPVILKIANDSKGAITQAIMKNRTMDMQPSLNVGRFSVYRGY